MEKLIAWGFVELKRQLLMSIVTSLFVPRK